MPLYFSILFILNWFLLAHQRKLERYRYVKRAGTLYQNLKVKSPGALLYNVIFLTTRFVFALIVVAFHNVPGLQIQPVAFLTTLQAFYSLTSKPFTSRWLNYFDFINQSVAAVLSFMIICFTEYNENNEA